MSDSVGGGQSGARNGNDAQALANERVPVCEHEAYQADAASPGCYLKTPMAHRMAISITAPTNETIQFARVLAAAMPRAPAAQCPMRTQPRRPRGSRSAPSGRWSS